ncbi:DUF6195 family protein [Streptomyces phaeochromogenes]|uniref:DUF6195 family protein n=1 Tax=Streptomyces phaeochromogenes TaxID=1923 RepID=UPI0036AF84D9
MNATDLITAAQAAHAEDLALQAEEAAGMKGGEEEERLDFLRSAADHAVKVLGQAAEGLPWIYAPEDLPEHTFAATAALAPSRAHDAHLTYLFDAHNGQPLLALVRTCRSCTDELTNPITSLAELGRLLDEDQQRDRDAVDTDAQEPGPLAAVEQTESIAARVALLARRLVAEHPDTGLAIQHVSLFGHEHGDGRADIHFNADGLDALRQVAAALGAEVTVEVSGSVRPFVFEHGTATSTVDGIDVELRAYSQLSHDEAAAWRAQQDQPASGGEGE